MPNRMMANRRSPVLLALLVAGLALSSAALAQVTRVAVFPFDVPASAQAYQLGLSGAVQRSLNQIPNVYAAPVGDVALVANRAVATEQDVERTVGRLFDASALITGQVTLAGGGVSATVNVEIGGGVQTVEASGQDPQSLASALIPQIARLVAPQLGASDLARVEAAAAATPSLPSLAQTGLSASGLPGVDRSALQIAADLDAESAWVRSEYAKSLALGGQLERAVTVANEAAALAPDDVEVQATVGVVLNSAGQDEEAAGAFGRALALNPAHAIALAGRASVADVSGSDARADLQAAIAAYPRFVDAHIRLAELETDPVRALQTLRRGEDAAPESILLRSAVLDLLLSNNDAASALAYLQQSVTQPLARSASLYALARVLPPSQQTAALALVEEGLAAFPDSTELAVAKADLLLQGGQAEEAEAMLQAIYDENPSNSSVGNLLAVAKARRGDIAGAQAIFEAQRGSGPQVDRNLAELYVAAGRAGAALDLLEPLVAEDPEDAQLQALYGTALTRIGRLDEGEAALRRALELNPSNALAQRSLSLLEQQRSLTGEAEIQFSEEAGAAFQQGLYALNANDFEAAAQAFARSRQEADNPLAAFYHGYAKQLIGDSRGAVADYQIALEAFPDSDIVLNNLGYAHLQLGRYDLALEYIRRAVAQNPENSQARLNLGLVHYALGQYESAISELQAAADLDPALSGTVEELIAASRRALGQ